MKTEEPITAYGQLDLNRLYTYWDYLKWQFDERVELIRGKIFKMSPAPGFGHQTISMALSSKIYQILTGGGCTVIAAPFDVRLPVPNANKDNTVVQPDICVVCDRSKIDERGCNGAPDLVVEILSPQNGKHDTVTKFQLYEESGVKEYWIVNPAEKLILIYSRQNNKFIGLPPIAESGLVTSQLFPQLAFDASEIFIQ